MKKIRIVVGDSNSNYLESLAAFFRRSEHKSRFIVTYFSQKEKMEAFLRDSETTDILLLSTDFHTQGSYIQQEASIILLEDDNIKAKKENGTQSVYRYQRLDQLVSQVLSFYYERNQSAGKLLARSKQTKVLSVFSPAGGSGKSVLAANLCKQLALNDNKTFYLNLELMNTTSLYFTSSEDNPSLQIFYYVKSESPQLLSKIEALKKYDPYSMVDYFDVAVSADEMLDIKEEDVIRLVNGIVETGSYDYVVVDLDSSLHERNLAAIKEADQIIWPISNDHQSLLKTKAFFEEEAKLAGKENIIRDKTTILINKFNGNLSGEPESYGITIDGYLPFVESWLETRSGSELLGNEYFNTELLKILKEEILLGAEEVTTVGK